MAAKGGEAAHPGAAQTMTASTHGHGGIVWCFPQKAQRAHGPTNGRDTTARLWLVVSKCALREKREDAPVPRNAPR